MKINQIILFALCCITVVLNVVNATSCATLPTLTYSTSNPITYGSTTAATATCAATDSCAVQLQIGTNLCTGTPSCTYTTPILAAGTYGYTANDLTESGLSLLCQTTNILTVSQATPAPALPSFPANYVYGSTPTITASLPSVSNQLVGNLYENDVIVASTNSVSNTISYSVPVLSVGTYTFTFNTIGNGNYIAATVSNSFTVSQATPSPAQHHSATAINSGATVLGNTTLQVSESIMNKIYFENYNITLKFVTNYSGSAYVSIKNLSTFSTTYSQCTPAVLAFQINASTRISVINVSLPYKANYTNIVPAMCKKGTWESIKNYTLNPYLHIINFTIPSDPVIGLIYPNNAINTTTIATTSSTTISSTTTTSSITTTSTTESTTTIGTATTTLVQAISTQPPQNKLNSDFKIISIAMIVIIIIAVVVYFKLFGTIKRNSKRKVKKRRTQ